VEFKNRIVSVLLVGLTSLCLQANATPYDHIHLAAPNAQEAAEWYARHFDGRVGRFRDSEDTSIAIDRAFFDGISVIFFERDPGEGSVGSGVDHIGFSMPNVEQVFNAAVADGATSLGELTEFNGMKLGFLVGPWGTKIELIDAPDLRGAHHVHLSSEDPAATLAWYLDTFGGEERLFGGVLPGAYYGNLWVLAAQATGPVAPTQGRSMDHLGWRFDDLDGAAEEMKGKGVEFTMEPRDYRGIRISFVAGPEGVRIEVVEP